MIKYYIGAAIVIFAFFLDVLASLGSIPSFLLCFWGLFIMMGPILDGTLWRDIVRLWKNV